MDIKTEVEYPLGCELLCDASAEQPVEGEFTLPEYGPGVFRIVRTIAEPEIVQRIAAGARATVEGYLKLTIIYLSENGGRMSSVVQRLPFSKQFELVKAVNGASECYTEVSVAYLNCRAVNERRIDARGALNVSLKVVAGFESAVVKSVSGQGVQLRSSTAEYLRERATEEKQFTLDEELELDCEECEAPRLLRASAEPVIESVELGERRAVVAGYINVKLAADVSGEDELRVKRAGFNLPFSQVVEINASTEGAFVSALAAVPSCTASFEGKNIVSLTATTALELRLFERAETNYVSDAFCTLCELETTRAPLMLMSSRDEVSEPITVKFTTEAEGDLVSLIDYYIAPPVFSPAPDELGVKGRSTLCCTASDALGEIVARDYPFEFVVHTSSAAASGPYSRLWAVFENVDCSLEGGKLSLRCEGEVLGAATALDKLDALASASGNESAPKTGSRPALRIYYAEAGEELWEIAKRFDASADGIALENGIEGERTPTAGPLLIPAAI